MSLPPWIKQKAPSQAALEMKELLDALNLATVCESAHCPNLGECFSRGTATVMILGDRCTRSCRFCAVQKGSPLRPDPEEPGNIALLVKKLGLKHVVITSVTRDDLPDGGAGHFAATIEAVRGKNPSTSIEVLVPDFQGKESSIAAVVGAKPHIVNHNLETISRLYSQVRPGAGYLRSLHLLKRVKELNPRIHTKSGIMVGLGERKEEVFALMDDLIRNNCHILTIGQYLRPSRDHLAVVEYVEPRDFEEYRRVGMGKGFRFVASAPLVRSSYNAEDARFLLEE